MSTVSGFEDIRDETHTAIDAVLARVAAHFGGHHPAKQEQVKAAAAALRAHIDDLHDTVPTVQG